MLKLLERFKKKKSVDKNPRVHPEAMKIVEARFTNSTPTNPQIGVCVTCNPNQIKFLSQLRDIDDDRSCFMLNHQVEPLAGAPDFLSQEFKRQCEGAEYHAWREGELDL